MTNPDYRAMCAELLLFSEEAGEICMNESLWPKSDPTCTLQQRARALLASSVDQDDVTLKFIREHTPRYRMSVIISTNDCCIDTRMNVIWSALNSDTEILESVSLPEKLPPCENS